jgi:hypothetical protein
MLARTAWIGQELRAHVVSGRERWMTVGVAAEVVDGQRRLAWNRVGERPTWSVAPGMSSAVPRGDVSRLDGATTFATIIPACRH